ncbi:Shedu anti-phage system protein SduA domain-containing protein [Bacillus sp. FSL R12-0074]|uniref:Shedu anti-phage system protein SduA domain-containing protein n=1 Tax=Bacillus sp. FSL R12-0074 TaxID=2954664 RepID=UPI000D49E816
MNDLIERFRSALEDDSLNENDIQRFLEENSELISTPFLLNHHLHFNVLISKFKISDGLISDFAYLTKSSDFWDLVLVEIEDPKKRIFTSNSEQVNFHSNFNHAMDQIFEWKGYIEQNSEEIKRRIDPLKIPLKDRPIRFKYVLIYGRNAEKENNLRKTRMFGQKTIGDVRVLTFDSLISEFMCSKYKYGKMILSHWREGYKVKSVPSNIETSIFAYLNSSMLKLDAEQKRMLIQQGYDIEKWEDGHSLSYNSKYASLTDFMESGTFL